VRINGEWITRADVGSISDQPDAGDQLKAAYSDALKRAAVAFGIGRYLYRLPSQWVDYDPVKKQIASVPQLPTLGSLGITRPSSRPSAKQVLKVSTCPDQCETKLPASGDHIQVWIDDARERIKAAGRLAELLVVWNSLTPEIQGHVVGDKERRKGELVAEQSAPAN
jgi:hypothetical protein